MSAMRHFPFLEVLSQNEDVHTPVWRDVGAGYLVLRLFDRWLEDGTTALKTDPLLPEIRERVLAMTAAEPRVREPLAAVVRAMLDTEAANLAAILDPFLMYSRYLQSAGYQPLSVHICITILEALDVLGAEDPLPRAKALMEYAYVARTLGDFDASMTAYQCARTLATEAGDALIVLRSKIGMSYTLKAHGNLGEAEELLDQVILESVDAGMRTMEGWALHSRGIIRTARGFHTDALRDLVRASKLITERSERELLLGDLASTAWNAGYRQVARDISRILAYTARQPVVRSAALINLLEYTTYDGTATECERLHAQIGAHAQRHSLPVEHAVHLALYTAYGVERFGTRDAAINAYRTVIVEAEGAEVHQVAFKAEQHLAALVASGTVIGEG